MVGGEKTIVKPLGPMVIGAIEFLGVSLSPSPQATPSCNAHNSCNKQTKATMKQTMQLKFSANVTIYVGFDAPMPQLIATIFPYCANLF